MVIFSKSLIHEYKTEIATTYGIFLSEADAQIHLRTLTRALFPTDTTVKKTESKEIVQGKATSSPACARSLSVTMNNVGGRRSRASITPTPGHRDNGYE